jgi:hypothetical protein
MFDGLQKFLRRRRLRIVVVFSFTLLLFVFLFAVEPSSPEAFIMKGLHFLNTTIGFLRTERFSPSLKKKCLPKYLGLIASQEINGYGKWESHQPRWSSSLRGLG